MEYIVCGIDAGTGAPIWDVFDLEFASAAPAQGGRADPETVATDECEMLDGVCDQYDYSGFVLPGAKDTLAHYESVTPIQLALFEEA